MEHTGLMVLNAPNKQIAYADTASGMAGAGAPFAPFNIEPSSEARRFLFAHDENRKDAPMASFPGKFAWIAVVLFVLSVLIAVIG